MKLPPFINRKSKRKVMKKIILIGVLCCATIANAWAQNGFLGILGAVSVGSQSVVTESKSLYSVGLEGGLLFNKMGIKLRFETDLYHPFSSSDTYEQEVIESLGSKYRVSYTGGFMYNPYRFLWLAIDAGYGEYGTYGQTLDGKTYGVLNKIKGAEVGVDVMAFIYSSLYISLGYSTILSTNSLQERYNGIKIGVGILF